MKKKSVTYGITGMMEYQAVIPVGKATVKVTFTDGTMSATGMTPARYMTDNMMIQHAIEHSPQYKKGLIRKLQSIELDEEVVIGHNVKKQAEEPVVTSADGERKKEPVADGEEKEKTPAEQKKPAEQKEPVEQEKPTETSADGEEKGKTLGKVKVSDIASAKDYLADTFGINRTAMRSTKAIMEQAAANGVEFEGLE